MVWVRKWPIPTRFATHTSDWVGVPFQLAYFQNHSGWQVVNSHSYKAHSRFPCFSICFLDKVLVLCPQRNQIWFSWNHSWFWFWGSICFDIKSIVRCIPLNYLYIHSFLIQNKISLYMKYKKYHLFQSLHTLFKTLTLFFSLFSWCTIDDSTWPWTHKFFFLFFFVLMLKNKNKNKNKNWRRWWRVWEGRNGRKRKWKRNMYLKTRRKEKDGLYFLCLASLAA